MRRSIGYITLWLMPLILLPGCSTLKEGTKCVMGVSTKVLEDNRKGAITRTFDYDYHATYNKSMEALKAMEAYVYYKGAAGQLIAVYVSTSDTTPVGVFFKAVDNAHTQVEISSPSTYAKELIAKRLFARLAGLPDPTEKKEEASPLEKPL
jgi:hypothetical protein